MYEIMRIVPKEGGMRGKNMNSFFLLHWEAFVFNAYLHVKCDCFTTFLRKYELPIWVLWRAGNLTLNPVFWSIKGESIPGRWRVWESDHKKENAAEDCSFNTVREEWKQISFLFVFIFWVLGDKPVPINWL